MIKNYKLILALGIPLLLILAVVASIYIPSKLGQPSKYNFIYEVDDSYYQQYTVTNNKLSQLPPPNEKTPYTVPVSPKICLHNTADNSNKLISYEDAAKLKINGDYTSPDGYTIQNGRGNESLVGFIFGGANNYNRLFMNKGSYNKEINIVPNNYNFHFLAWVIQ